MKISREHLLKSWPFWLALMAGLLVITAPILGLDFSRYPGDFGDARFNTYILEHCHQFFIGQEDSFWNAGFMYPETSVISYSDNLVGTAPLYSVARFLGADPFMAFQWWYLLLTIGNFVACYAFLNYLFRNPYAAALGAFVFAFSLVLQTQLTHAQTYPRMFIPLALWMLLLYKDELRAKYLFWATLFLVWQFYAGIYLGFLLSIPFGLLFFLILFQERKSFKERIRERKWLLYSFGAVLVNFALLLNLMIPYYVRSRTNAGMPYYDIVGTLPTIRSFFCSKSGTLFWDGLTNVTKFFGEHWDHQLFPGLLTLLAVGFFFLALLFLRKRIQLPEHLRSLWLLGTVGVLTCLLVFRINEYSLYYFIYHIPGFSSMRALGRVINVELLFFALATAFAVFMLNRKWPKYTKVGFVLILALLSVDNYLHWKSSYTVYKKDITMRQEAMLALMKDVPEGSVISYEPTDDNVPAYFHQLDAMLAAQALKLKTLNGYTATSPPAYSDYWWEPNEKTRTKWLDSLPIKEDTLYIFSESIGITPKFGK